MDDVLFALPEDSLQDRALEEAVKRMPNLIFPVAVHLLPRKKVFSEEHNEIPWAGIPPTQTARRYFFANRAIFPLDSLTRVVGGLGHIATNRDEDGVIRRVPLLVRYRNRLVPSLAFHGVLRFLNVSLDKVRIKKNEIILEGAKNNERAYNAANKRILSSKEQEEEYGALQEYWDKIMGSSKYPVALDDLRRMLGPAMARIQAQGAEGRRSSVMRDIATGQGERSGTSRDAIDRINRGELDAGRQLYGGLLGQLAMALPELKAGAAAQRAGMLSADRGVAAPIQSGGSGLGNALGSLASVLGNANFGNAFSSNMQGYLNSVGSLPNNPVSLNIGAGGGGFGSNPGINFPGSGGTIPGGGNGIDFGGSLGSGPAFSADIPDFPFGA